MSAFHNTLTSTEQMQLVRRIAAARSAGLINPVFCDHGHFYIAVDPLDPHTTRVPISLPKLFDLLERVEAGPSRKPVSSETLRFPPVEIRRVK